MTSKALESQKVAHRYVFRVEVERAKVDREVAVPAYDLPGAVLALRQWLAEQGYEELGAKWTRLKAKETNP